MDNKELSLLYEDALAYDFAAIDEAIAKRQDTPSEDLSELYLIRAQIKLSAADETSLADLQAADNRKGPPKYPLLFFFSMGTQFATQFIGVQFKTQWAEALFHDTAGGGRALAKVVWGSGRRLCHANQE